MTFITALLSQWRMGLLGLIAAGLLIAGWVVNGWRLQAAEARGLHAQLQSEMAARVKSDADRLTLGLQLSDAEAKIITNVKTITQRVKVYVPQDRVCDIGLVPYRLLDAARRNLPAASDPPAPTAPSP